MSENAKQNCLVLGKKLEKTHQLKFLSGIQHCCLKPIQSNPQSEKHLKRKI